MQASSLHGHLSDDVTDAGEEGSRMHLINPWHAVMKLFDMADPEPGRISDVACKEKHLLCRQHDNTITLHTKPVCEGHTLILDDYNFQDDAGTVVQRLPKDNGRLERIRFGFVPMKKLKIY